jgi:hypothetical protein
MFDFVSKWWCRIAHQNVYRPIRGYYRCATCLRAWPVPWETAERGRISETRAQDHCVAAGT